MKTAIVSYSSGTRKFTFINTISFSLNFGTTDKTCRKVLGFDKSNAASGSFLTLRGRVRLVTLIILSINYIGALKHFHKTLGLLTILMRLIITITIGVQKKQVKAVYKKVNKTYICVAA